jgi:hypothetical protein
MKPSSDIDLFTTTLPFPVPVSLICSSEPAPPLRSPRIRAVSGDHWLVFENQSLKRDGHSHFGGE